MNLVIDSGNTRFKAATFSGTNLEEKYSFLSKVELKDFLNHHTFNNAIVSSVSLDGNEMVNWIKASKKILLTHLVPLPIQIKYKTPETLGVDRIAAVCGVVDIFPNKNSLVIDA